MPLDSLLSKPRLNAAGPARQFILVSCAAILAASAAWAQAPQTSQPDAPPQSTAPATPPPAAAPVAPAAAPDAPAAAPGSDAAQQPVPATNPQTAAPAAAEPAPPAPQAPAVAPPAAAPAAPPTAAQPSQADGISEEQLRQMLVGKPLYLRGGYLDNTLNFGEHGQIIGHPAQGSYTLSGVEIEKVHLSKHKVELEGARYALHFLGALPYEDPTKAVDRVKITPKKKVLKITIDRELVISPKKKKEKEKDKPAKAPPSKTTPAPAATPVTPTSTAAEPAEPNDADEAKAEMAAAPAAERPADPSSVTTTISPAHAGQVLKEALDRVFAPGLDDRLMASMPDFWKLYYQAAAAHADYRPKDPAVLRQNTVDQKAKLLSTFEPASNEYAQASGVAGVALYHTVIGPDGKPVEIAVGRPIGFGLDENAVDSIRKASFQPAIKDGKPVSVMLDLVVQFRIYSKRTAVTGKSEPDQPAEPLKPGPYSVQHP